MLELGTSLMDHPIPVPKNEEDHDFPEDLYQNDGNDGIGSMP
jgi:hypothetical protein